MTFHDEMGLPAHLGPFLFMCMLTLSKSALADLIFSIVRLFSFLVEQATFQTQVQKRLGSLL